MPHIRPVSDLRNHLADIARLAHETSEPIFLTENGCGHMVIMSMEAFERHKFDIEVYCKLKEAEMEAKTTGKRFTDDEMLYNLRRKLREKTTEV
jgi:PHD/YefM family antitoxin component YafN of YafNO toxin-antitoxin module